MKFKEQLQTLIEKYDETWYDIALLCHKFASEKLYIQEGYESFKEYLKNEFPNTSYAYFIYQIKMAEVILRYSLRKEEILEIGWSKFRHLASYVLAMQSSKEELQELMQLAKTMPYSQFRKYLHMKKLQEKYNEEPIVHIKFKMTSEQYEILQQALEKAKEIAQIEHPTLLLTYICLDFLYTSDDSPEKLVELKTQLAQVGEIPKIRKVHSKHNKYQ